MCIWVGGQGVSWGSLPCSLPSQPKDFLFFCCHNDKLFNLIWLCDSMCSTISFLSRNPLGSWRASASNFVQLKLPSIVATGMGHLHLERAFKSQQLWFLASANAGPLPSLCSSVLPSSAQPANESTALTRCMGKNQIHSDLEYISFILTDFS